MCVFAGKYEDRLLQRKERINILFLMTINLLGMSEIRSKEYFRWIHCFKLVNKATRSRMKVSKRKDSLSIIILLHKPKLIAIELQYLISVCRVGYSSSFISVYEILIKCELVKPTHAVIRIKSKSMFDNFGTCFKKLRSPTDCLAVKSGSPTQHLGSRTSISVECCTVPWHSSWPTGNSCQSLRSFTFKHQRSRALVGPVNIEWQNNVHNNAISHGLENQGK